MDKHYFNTLKNLAGRANFFASSQNYFIVSLFVKKENIVYRVQQRKTKLTMLITPTDLMVPHTHQEKTGVYILLRK
jgi:hypothetical protein